MLLTTRFSIATRVPIRLWGEETTQRCRLTVFILVFVNTMNQWTKTIVQKLIIPSAFEVR